MKNFYLKPKLFDALNGYDKNQFIHDLIAGIIVAIIALPLSIALALASGVEPACGVYTAITAGFIVSMLGGSRVQIAGPTAGMVHAVVLLLVLLFLMPYAALIPIPTIAAILFIVAYNMSEWREVVQIVKTKNIPDIIITVITFLFTVIFDLVVAIAVGMAVALLFKFYHYIKNRRKGVCRNDVF